MQDVWPAVANRLGAGEASVPRHPQMVSRIC